VIGSDLMAMADRLHERKSVFMFVSKVTNFLRSWKRERKGTTTEA
jgi:hypothetical protein